MDSKLCNDMVKIEILSRTSLKTLDAMRCTSKEFEKLTYEPYLFDLYKQRNDIISGFLVETNNKPLKYINEFAPSRGSKSIDLGFLPPNARIQASSEQGIIVFESRDPRTYGLISYYVCKPTTKQVLAVPILNSKYLTQKAAIVVVASNPLHYKILRLSRPVFPVSQTQDKLYTPYFCEIFDSRTWEWKVLDMLMLPFCVFPTNPQPITTRGSIYMLLTNKDILKFDAYSENWSIFSSPIPTLDYESRQLIKHEGKLGFACKPLDGRWEIWDLGIDESWEKICVFNEEEDINARKPLNDPNTRGIMDSNKILFYKGNTVDKVALIDQSYKLFVYRSDFEPSDLMGRLE